MTAFRRAFIEHIKALELAVGGGTDEVCNVFVTSTREGNSVTPAQRDALLAWLCTQPGVFALTAGERVSIDDPDGFPP